MSERVHHVGGEPYPPRRWDDEDTADIADAADDAHRQNDDIDLGPEMWADVEWSADQTFVGEFGQINQFGEPID